MLLSMTGYGRVTETFKDKVFTVEIRSLNSKFTDVRLKLPQQYRDKETEIRKMITDQAERGKIDFSLDIKSLSGDDEYTLNEALFRRYHRELTRLGEELGFELNQLLPSILRLPNVVAPDELEVDEEEWSALATVIQAAIDKFQRFRRDEGKVMEADITLHINEIVALQDQLEPHERQRITRLRERLQQNLEESLPQNKVDQNRFEQEILYYLEKMDITEEKVRLAQHCRYFLAELEKNTTQKGRKLNFISQEIGREINTLGAKAHSSDIQRLVVNMKDQLEKIKEQIANAL